MTVTVGWVPAVETGVVEIEVAIVVEDVVGEVVLVVLCNQ